MVERFNLDVKLCVGDYIPIAVKDPDGDYVEYDDYAKLEAMLRKCVNYLAGPVSCYAGGLMEQSGGDCLLAKAQKMLR